MILSELSEILKDLTICNESVSLPSMGRFIIEETPSELLEGGLAITPPNRKILFSSSDEEQDSLIVESLARMKGIPDSSARAEVADLLRSLKRELITNGIAEIPYFGSIRYSREGAFEFEPDSMFNIAADYYGLEPLSLKLRETGKELEEEKKIETESDVKSDIVAENGKKSVWRGVMIGVAVAISVILLLIAVILIFREELMPLLEKLLYSEEELEILRKAGENR